MTTEILGLTEMTQSQGSKYATLNKMVREIEGRTIMVKSRTTTAEPASPANGDTYIIPTGKTGTNWATFAVNDIAHYYGGAWYKYTPLKYGIRLWVDDEDVMVMWRGSWTVDLGIAGATGYVVHDMASDADYNLTIEQTNAEIIEITDTSPTVVFSNRNIVVFNLVKRKYIFINSTGVTLTLKTSGGTGIAVQPGMLASLVCDGTNIVQDYEQLSGIVIGSAGNTLSRMFNVSSTLDFGSISAQSSADLTITVTGAQVGDSVVLGLPSSPTAGIVFNAFVSAADTVTVRAHNYTGSPIDPASASYAVTVLGF